MQILIQQVWSRGSRAVLSAAQAERGPDAFVITGVPVTVIAAATRIDLSRPSGKDTQGFSGPCCCGETSADASSSA